MLELVQMTEPVSDDDLFAFVDGALSDQERRRVEAALASDVTLGDRLEKAKRAMAALKAAYPQPASPADRFERIVEEGFRERERAHFRPRSGFDWRQPMAAALAFGTIAGGGGYWLGQAGSSQAGLDLVLIERGNPLFAALEQTASGEVARVGADGAVKPILTFASADGGYCREVEFDSAQAASVGVACREGDGWRVVALAAAETGPAEGGYATVDEGAAAAIEGVFERLGAGDPLSPEAEQALINSNWQAR